ncbi:hypothetical protein [Mucilaginibacter sp.]|uniref:hypothetical protein n=1 Tax=Mucilaginibacter sp. TaxID=1882438 RepID=UPI003D11CC66
MKNFEYRNHLISDADIFLTNALFEYWLDGMNSNEIEIVSSNMFNSLESGNTSYSIFTVYKEYKK